MEQPRLWKVTAGQNGLIIDIVKSDDRPVESDYDYMPGPIQIKEMK